ncbi:FAD-binding protein [Prevotella copri]|uniref:FAD-binding protein n=2 Tax=Segatella TaxID=2974251 RepID=A0AA90VLN5_9BACT|nr:FAD-binding protein [Segatella copri]MBU9911989.1 FAD-binding protein [Segatella copri]MBV3399778.1 FAD-binding protein [Segatella copri]MBV3409333.1 FAD-binding protein [Segatella copri]MBV3412293.1 FAD-binding protein [Segatella copri]MBV3420702.1 FAD-binding protein [Segatella copri]
MIQEFQIRILPEQAASEEGIKRYLAKEKGLDVRTLNQVRVLKRSIDARQRTIFVNLKVRAYINEFPQDDQYVHTEYPDVSSRPRVIVVGEGPGGLFASLRLIELGYRPIVLERGKDVRERKKDLSNITKTQKVDGESNYCFGEGGAGAYSDGKLYTRSKKRGSVDKILNVFCQHGANTNILADAHPHIGTDKLPRVIENMRNTIIKCGGEVHFQTKMIRLILESEGKLTAPDAAAGDRVIGVEAVNLATGAEETYRGPVILATGHSARDVYRYLASAKIDIEAKGIAVGVRLEHPSQLIDQIQYHNKSGRGKYLPAAEYSFVTQVDGRGVYSFCMCPGGFVIPAATGPEQLVVNGMSPSNRGTAWSNSGMVVETHPEDVAQFVKEYQSVIEQQEMKAQENASLFTPHSSLQMMYFQEIVEKQCWQQGNMKQTAPAQRMADFVNNRLSYDLPKSSYAPGLISSPLHFWMPSFVSKRLQEGFKTFGKNAHGFLTNEATLIAMETRTSSPVRIVRDRETLQHVRIQGLFPCGEGAGYAGGIVSAGVDGERCAEMCAEYLKQQ